MSFIGYSTSDGLNDDHISGISQDSRGFYWISSQGGLNRFDGKFFKPFFPVDLAGDNRLTDNAKVFFENRPGHLAVTVGNGQLFELDCIFPQLIRVDNFKNRVVADVFRANPYGLFIGCIDTVFVTDNSFRILKEVPVPGKPPSLSLKARPMGKQRWLMNNWMQQFVFDGSGSLKNELVYDIKEHDYSKSGFEVLYVDTVNEWLYAINFFRGLLKMDYSGNVLFNWNVVGMPGYEITHNANKMIPSLQNDSLYWLSGDNGITLLNSHTHKTHHYARLSSEISNPLVLDLYADQSGKLWVGTDKGLFVSSRYSSVVSWNLDIKADEQPMNIIRSRQDGQIYVSKYYGDVCRIDPTTDQDTPFHTASMKDSWFIFEDGEALIQGGKGTTLTYYHHKTGKIQRNSMLSPYFKNSEVVVMGFRQGNGDLWFSANGGGGLARVRDGVITRYSKENGDFSHSYLTHWAEDTNGDLWFSSNKTPILLRWISRSGCFEEIDFGNMLRRYGIYRSVIHCLAMDGKGNLWLGFDGSGLLRYHPPSGKFFMYTRKNGLPSNFVYSLVFDAKGRLWIGTRNGLACLEQERGRVSIFNDANGFPANLFDNSCAYFDTSANRLWIGARGKILAFNPDRLLEDGQARPAIYIDVVDVNNRNIDIRNPDALRLNPSENNINIHFVTLNHVYPGDGWYSYSLNGMAGPWIEVGNTRQVNFPNLSYGNYEFVLRGKVLGNEEWVYLDNPVRFTIATPWYRTAWFTVLVMLGVLSVIFVMMRAYYRAKVQKQKNLIEKQLAVQAERDRISFDMHDDLGSGLTRISYLSQMAMNKNGQSAELDKIKHTSQQLVGNMSELIWAMKAENDNLADMLGYLKRYTSDYFDSDTVRLSFKMPGTIEERMIPGEKRRNIFLVYKEALHNIAKHADASYITVDVSVTDAALHIHIADNGQGFDFESHDLKSGNGLRSMQMRTLKFGGKMELESELGKGTALRFIFPI